MAQGRASRLISIGISELTRQAHGLPHTRVVDRLDTGVAELPVLRSDGRRPIELGQHDSRSHLLLVDGTRQQEGLARLTISKLPRPSPYSILRRLTPKQTVADEIFAQFRDRRCCRPTKLWRDEARQAIDRAVLIDLRDFRKKCWSRSALLRYVSGARNRPSMAGRARLLSPRGPDRCQSKRSDPELGRHT